MSDNQSPQTLPDFTSPADTLSFYYLKSNFFRVIHADGGVGGITPQGNIQIDVYNERLPLPQQVVYSLNTDYTLGEEITEQRVSKEGIVREVEVQIVLGIEEAEGFHEWLGLQIERAQEMREQIEKEDDNEL